MDQSDDGRHGLKKLKSEDHYLLSLLCFINMLNYFDRFSVSTVLIDIQRQFDLNNAQGGLLHSGLLLAITFSAPIFGYCGDRFSRKWLIFGSMFIWIVSTVAGAFSNNYYALLCSRFLVGVGQSGYTIIAPTIVADIVSGDSRTMFLSIFYLGAPIGVGLAYPASTYVSAWTGSWSYGICVGPIILAICWAALFFLRFPNRGQAPGEKQLATTAFKSSFVSDLRYLWKVPTFVHTTLAFLFCAFFVGAVMWWFPKCLNFGFQLMPGITDKDLKMATLYFGVVSVVSGIFGILAGLLLAKYLRRKYPKVDTIICGAGVLFSVPIAFATLTQIANSRVNTFVLVFFCMVGVNLKWALQTDILLYVIHPYRRTSARGVHLFIGHTFGDCISPYIVGFMADYFQNNFNYTNGTFFLPYRHEKPANPGAINQEFHSLQQSLSLTVVFLFVAGVFHFIPVRYILSDREKAQSFDGV